MESDKKKNFHIIQTTFLAKSHFLCWPRLGQFLYHVNYQKHLIIDIKTKLLF